MCNNTHRQSISSRLLLVAYIDNQCVIAHIASQCVIAHIAPDAWVGLSQAVKHSADFYVP